MYTPTEKRPRHDRKWLAASPFKSWVKLDCDKLSETLSAKGFKEIAKKVKEHKIAGNQLDDMNEDRLKELGISEIERYKFETFKEDKAMVDAKRKVFNDPIHGNINLHPLCVRIIDTPQFQRLRYIKQLGGVYFVYPGASHNRFEHSLGVCHLAGKLVRALQTKQPSLNITDEDVLCVEIAGLCHDIGHGPFSHMFDQMFIPAMCPGSNWKHEDASKAMFYYMYKEKENGLEKEFEKYDLSENDVSFIVELITGKPDKRDPSTDTEGRDKDKSFLYEIVANKKNSIDVDKWDYFARDCHMLGIGNNFDHNRCIEFARVLDVDGEDQICWRDKEADKLYDMFCTRLTLHRRAYQHTVGNSIEIMISEAMTLANDHITVKGKDGKPIKMSESTEDMQAYSQLTDYVFFQILHSTGEDEDLVKAREILQNILKRQLYKYVEVTHFEYEKGSSKPEMSHEKDKMDQVRDQIINCIENSTLQKEDVIVHPVNFNFGMKTENPIDKVRFYSKANPEKAFQQKMDEMTKIIPTVFSEQRLTVYCKRMDEESLSMLKKAFDKWCEKKGYKETIIPKKEDAQTVYSRLRQPLQMNCKEGTFQEPT